MKRITGIVLLLALALTVVACGEPAATPTPLPTATPIPSPTPLPTTPYSNASVGLSATLPGSDWMAPRPVPSDTGNNFAGEVVVNTAKTLFFVPSRTANNPNLPDDQELGVYVSTYKTGFLSGPATQSNETFHGYPAVRLEGVAVGNQIAGDGHYVIYVFFAGRNVFVIIAGSSVPTWDKGGQAQVQAIFDSIVLK